MVRFIHKSAPRVPKIEPLRAVPIFRLFLFCFLNGFPRQVIHQKAHLPFFCFLESPPMSNVNWAGDLLGQDLSDELEETEVRLEEFVSQRVVRPYASY